MFPFLVLYNNAMAPKVNPKSLWLSKVQVSKSKKAAYVKAWKLRCRRDPSVSFADWLRLACDSQALRDLQSLDAS